MFDKFTIKLYIYSLSILSQAQRLGIHCNSETSPFQLSKEDQQVAKKFNVSDQQPIGTLEKVVI